MGFKEDASFLRYLTMGAQGAAEVAEDLNSRHGHAIVELERYAMANKLWITKVKRLRLPDLMCVDCGLRIEARAKSALAIKLSHSDTPGREWDAGMRDCDLYAFVRCTIDDGTVHFSGLPHYFATEALREARGFARLGARKSASQGSEIDLTWPARVPKQDGVVTAVGDHEVATLLDGNRKQTYKLTSSVPAHAYVAVGERFVGEGALVIGVVAPTDDMACAGQVWPYADDFEAASPVDRYSAVKAAAYMGDEAAMPGLELRARDRDEDPRVRLEALGSLSLLDPERWTRHLEAIAKGAWPRGDLAMEATLILSELDTEPAAHALAAIAKEPGAPEELRAAAVWGLGSCGVSRESMLLEFIDDPHDVIATHAIASMRELTDDLVARLQEMVRQDDRSAASAVEVLRRNGAVEALLELARGNGAVREWAVLGLGMLPAEDVSPRLPHDDPLRDVIAPLWRGQEKRWLGGEPEQQVALLAAQRIRHTRQTCAS